MQEIEGGCRCGAVRYKLALDALPPTYACHCLDCQTWSGSAFSQQTFVPEAALAVSGPVVVYEFTTPSGRTSTQRMCGVCHARIYNTNSARPNVAVVRAGTLDRSNELRVVAHISAASLSGGARCRQERQSFVLTSSASDVKPVAS